MTNAFRYHAFIPTSRRPLHWSFLPVKPNRTHSSQSFPPPMDSSHALFQLRTPLPNRMAQRPPSLLVLLNSDNGIIGT
ncbi:hypothetical protein ACRALDRAFT_1066261 [Sodiomyces alcalophilus JCM 7366]|uniref:uncharacterized protein n=1 Tax=Sodiomyces alcalophilus JCM 7366 TaxID=591952 RepID=UPI0039B60608